MEIRDLPYLSNPLDWRIHILAARYQRWRDCGVLRDPLSAGQEDQKEDSLIEDLLLFPPKALCSVTANRLTRVLKGEILDPPPVWLMRQAGRYLPEYRELRSTASSFLEFCYSPDLASEATLQPIRRFGFDAAILFSDILVVPDALGQKVSFETGEGPKLEPLNTSLAGIDEDLNLGRLDPVFETIRISKVKLDRQAALIGFCGAPWTLASYMIAGGAAQNQEPARLFAYRERESFSRLIEILVRASVKYLIAQADAGVDSLQIFDSWAGVLPAAECARWCLEPLKAIIRGVREVCPSIPIIAFPRGANCLLEAFAEASGADALGLDTNVDPVWANSLLPATRVLQGNIDPIALLAGGAHLQRAVDATMAAFQKRPHIVNLGHGVLPGTPVAHVKALVARVRGE